MIKTAMAAALLPVLQERGYRQPVARQPGWFDRDCPGGGFVRFTFEDDGTATATRMDYHGFRMTPAQLRDELPEDWHSPAGLLVRFFYAEPDELPGVAAEDTPEG